SVSKKAKYALQALYALARDYGSGPTLISDLAERERIPKKFLELILLQLKHEGVVHSKKGKGGGYFLARRPSAVTLGQIIRIFDGPLSPLPCASEKAYVKCEECRDENSCGTRLVMKEVRDAIAEILDRTTLKSVQERVDASLRRGGGGDYQ